jgi:hypothetical protein
MQTLRVDAGGRDAGPKEQALAVANHLRVATEMGHGVTWLEASRLERCPEVGPDVSRESRPRDRAART